MKMSGSNLYSMPFTDWPESLGPLLVMLSGNLLCIYAFIIMGFF